MNNDQTDLEVLVDGLKAGFAEADEAMAQRIIMAMQGDQIKLLAEALWGLEQCQRAQRDEKKMGHERGQ